MNNYLKLCKYMLPYTFIILVGAVFLIANVNISLLIPTITSQIIDNGIANHNVHEVIRLCSYMLIATVLSILFGIVTNILSTISSAKSTSDLRRDLFVKVQHMDFDTIDKIASGNIITRLINDITRIRQTNRNVQQWVFRTPVTIIASLFYAIALSPKLSIIFLIITPVLFFINYFIVKKAFPYQKNVQAKLDKVNTVSQESISNIRIIKSFVKEDEEVERFTDSIDELRDTTIRANKITSFSSPLTSFIMNLGVVAIIWFGGIETIYGQFEVGKIFAFMNYFTQLSGAILSLTNIISTFARAEASSQRIMEILNDKPQIVTENGAVRDIEGKIEFRNVSFSYHEGEKVLKNINLTINPGETVGIIGKNGTGKTTLIHLLHRFYDSTEGGIYIDDINIKDYDVNCLRKQISSVMQSTFLFAGSIEYNLKFANPEADDEAMINVSRLASAGHFIQELPNEYQTILGERGINLSGGQKQRLSIARTLLANPKILIFDDSTSAVDMKTESDILQSLNQKSRQTRIIIGQRIKSMAYTDKVIVLDNGEISGIGRHDDLIKTNPIYREIYQSQIGSVENE